MSEGSTDDLAHKRRVAITGTTGQLGRALVDAGRSDWDILPLNRRDFDLLNWDEVSRQVTAFAPDLVIHCAAATDVDGCERDPVMAYQANALMTRYVAQASAILDVPLLYVSTNFVFDGTKPVPYHEFDMPAPFSVYGASKLAGEREVLAATSRCFIVRTAMVYAREGRNFVTTMQRLMADRDRITVVADQFGNPTFASDLASAIIELTDRAPLAPTTSRTPAARPGSTGRLKSRPLFSHTARLTQYPRPTTTATQLLPRMVFWIR